MRRSLILCAGLFLAACGADGEPVTPASDTNVTLSSSGAAVSNNGVRVSNTGASVTRSGVTVGTNGVSLNHRLRLGPLGINLGLGL